MNLHYCMLFVNLDVCYEQMMICFHLLFSISLKIAFKWLMRAFSGFLASDQVLLLWDRILAYDSLEILSGNDGAFCCCS